VIAVSLVTLRPGAMGGSEQYARALAAALGRHGSLRYVCLVPAAAADAADGLPALHVGGMRGSAPVRLATLAAAAARGRSLRRLLPDVRAAHYPFTIAVPSLDVPAAVTLHDLVHHEAFDTARGSLRAFRRLAYDRPARRARLMIVPSAFVRDRVEAVLGVARERIRVIHHGIDHARFHPGDEAREPFLLYPARAWPHKNHARLFEAFALLRQERPELRLVLTGGGPLEEQPDGVEARGLVPVDELASLYRRAAALVFPSLHEGFGQPPLQAMACGCPVACSNATSLPEVCGDAAVLFDPHSAESIAAGVLQALRAEDDLRRRGLERAAGFTWERSARAHEDAYRELL
jgi:glycosyltransferase involved in cell wall biosynthesis